MSLLGTHLTLLIGANVPLPAPPAFLKALARPKESAALICALTSTGP